MAENRFLFQRIKHFFDRVTSENSTNWKLVLFWIFLFEIVASIIEYLYASELTKYSIALTHDLTTELILALFVTLFVWFSVYNIIFENKKYIIRLLFVGIMTIYFIVTNDFSLQFLLQNINPLHFFNLDFGFVFFIEVFLKLLIIYLIYQFVLSLRNNDTIRDN